MAPVSGDHEFSLIAKRLKALADPSRLSILHRLCDGEKNVTELVRETGLHQANVSKHLRILREEGLTMTRRNRQHIYYRLTNELSTQVCSLIRRSLGRGVAGVVINGYTRDLSRIREDGRMPVFARGAQPQDAYGKWGLLKHSIPVQMETTGGSRITIHPGDWVFGDADGVMVIPSKLAAKVATAAEKRAPGICRLRARRRPQIARRPPLAARPGSDGDRPRPQPRAAPR